MMRFCFFILLALIAQKSISQEASDSGIWVGCIIENGDTILVSYTSEVPIVAYRDTEFRKSNKYKITLRRVKKVYPYAMLASEMYDEYLDKIEEFDSKRDKKKYLKKEEKGLKERFEGKVRDITIKEGIILVKLIDRQTKHTSYQVVQELKGNGSAFLWQGIARIFSSSLKHEYDPEGDDWMIEDIVQRIMSGEIAVNSLANN